MRPFQLGRRGQRLVRASALVGRGSATAPVPLRDRPCVHSEASGRTAGWNRRNEPKMGGGYGRPLASISSIHAEDISEFRRMKGSVSLPYIMLQRSVTIEPQEICYANNHRQLVASSPP